MALDNHYECNAWKEITMKEMWLQHPSRTLPVLPRKGMTVAGTLILEGADADGFQKRRPNASLRRQASLTLRLTQSTTRPQREECAPLSQTSSSIWGQSNRPPRSFGGMPLRRAQSEAATRYHRDRSASASRREL
mmetsp:Transcript_100839/g.291599  ORF Transcript_100839/g.291599 Transcript_100839/m.291599 type:complete len:135 (-) Transcript_100839:61-465(-)